MSFSVTPLSINSEAQRPTLSVVLMTLLLKSPVTHLILAALHRRLGFRDHVLIQTTEPLFLAFYLILPFCRNCSNDSAFREVFQQVLSRLPRVFALDGVLSRLAAESIRVFPSSTPMKRQLCRSIRLRDIISSFCRSWFDRAILVSFCRRDCNSKGLSPIQTVAQISSRHISLLE